MSVSLPDVVGAGPVVSDVDLVAVATASGDLGAVPAAALDGLPARSGDVVEAAEKIAVVTSGRTVDARTLRAGPLARVLARAVRPVGDSCGLSLPAQDAVRAGRGRAVAGGAGRARRGRDPPARVPGSFYRLLGSTARDLDGLRGAYPDELLPPLRPGEAALLAHHLAARLGRVVAVVDVNDRGGSVRALSAGGPDPRALLAVPADNPHGDCGQSTPVVLLRPS